MSLDVDSTTPTNRNTFVSLGMALQTAIVQASVYSVTLLFFVPIRKEYTDSNANGDGYGTLHPAVVASMMFAPVLVLYCTACGYERVPLLTFAASSIVSIFVFVISTVFLQLERSFDTPDFDNDLALASFLVVMSMGLLFIYLTTTDVAACSASMGTFAFYVATYTLLCCAVFFINTRPLQDAPDPPLAYPPAPPGMYYRGLVTFSATVAGAVDSFNRSAYRQGVALLCPGIYEQDVALDVTAGSVRVATTISSSNLTAASGAYHILRSYTASSLSIVLRMTIESFGEVTYMALHKEHGSGYYDAGSGSADGL